MNNPGETKATRPPQDHHGAALLRDRSSRQSDGGGIREQKQVCGGGRGEMRNSENKGTTAARNKSGGRMR